MSNKMALFPLVSSFANLLLPPRCPACGSMVAEEHTFCADCWVMAPYLPSYQCVRCGIPIIESAYEGQFCLDCHQNEPPFNQAKSVFAYDDFSAPLVLALKLGDRCDLAPSFAQWMVHAAPEMLKRAEWIVPVPLHWQRLFKRRFNQSGLIARALAKQTGVPFVPNRLVRYRNTPPQGHLSRMARQKNINNAFKVTKAGCAGKTILLVDDVLTTGATVVGCTNALLRAGAQQVDVLTLCRVVASKS